VEVPASSKPVAWRPTDARSPTQAHHDRRLSSLHARPPVGDPGHTATALSTIISSVPCRLLAVAPGGAIVMLAVRQRE